MKTTDKRSTVESGNTPHMSKKDDSILFGAKRAGVTWLFKFEPAQFNRVKAGAQRLGLSLAEFICRTNSGMTGAPELPEPRKFTDADRKASTLKLQINPECDEFTRRCLERQADLWGGTVEEYLLNNVFMTLENDEEDCVLDPQTGEAVLEGVGLGNFFGCHVEKGAQLRERNVKFTRIPIPVGTIVEQCA